MTLSFFVVNSSLCRKSISLGLKGVTSVNSGIERFWMFLNIVAPEVVPACISIATILAPEFVFTRAETCGLVPSFVGEESESLPTVVALEVLSFEVKV